MYCRNGLLGEEEDVEHSYHDEDEVEKEVEVEEENQHHQHRIMNLRSTVPEPVVATTGMLCCNVYQLSRVFLQTRLHTLFSRQLVFCVLEFKFTATARCSIRVVRNVCEIGFARTLLLQ